MLLHWYKRLNSRTFRVWPLVENWEMPKETVTESGEGDPVRLKYTFRYGDKFDEPNDD
jgi:hypothetical protein